MRKYPDHCRLSTLRKARSAGHLLHDDSLAPAYGTLSKIIQPCRRHPSG
jgi:hypothetical protein